LPVQSFGPVNMLLPAAALPSYTTHIIVTIVLWAELVK
jgi:hypothetical protein